jgi:hypothetical protein
MLLLSSELDLTHLYASMSAACRMGYVKSPAFKKESSISDSSLAFLETANRVCEPHTCLVMVEDVCAKAQVPSTSSSASAFRPASDSSESKRVRHGSGPIRHVNGKIPRNSAMRICHLILMENNRPLRIYTRRKYERHHGRPRL